MIFLPESPPEVLYCDECDEEGCDQSERGEMAEWPALEDGTPCTCRCHTYQGDGPEWDE